MLKKSTIIAPLSAIALILNAAQQSQLAGPKGGRILEKTEPKAEFYIEKDRSVTIAFYDVSMKQVAPDSQGVSVIAETSGGKQKIEFERKGDVLASKTKLPSGEGY